MTPPAAAEIGRLAYRLDRWLARKEVYQTMLALFIGSSLFSILGNIVQHTALLQRLPSGFQTLIQTTGNICWGTVGMMAVRCFIPDKFRYKMEIGFLAISPYFALGESVVPQLLPGSTADLRDIPAAIAGGAIYYVYDRSRRLHHQMKDSGNEQNLAHPARN